ncbi:hypothetical protein K504DRAFT_21337 [Pleomassaria siparia CBS 279.74]|uniref:Uncharacterized protein n=1 Tax=Pleomassaria siparia CBS 279.74 TaxID=1314801 RepID=A0A6G1KS26_9PLEO|nr:hypothetical protein K504DRAFT_21337 [Pleomassaria siparia CBS 279.74]
MRGDTYTQRCRDDRLGNFFTDPPLAASCIFLAVLSSRTLITAQLASFQAPNGGHQPRLQKILSQALAGVPARKRIDNTVRAVVRSPCQSF